MHATELTEHAIRDRLAASLAEQRSGACEQDQTALHNYIFPLSKGFWWAGGAIIMF
jgi:hypothetical protein